MRYLGQKGSETPEKSRLRISEEPEDWVWDRASVVQRWRAGSGPLSLRDREAMLARLFDNRMRCYRRGVRSHPRYC